MLLERLIVQLDADLSGLDKGFTKAHRTVSQFGKDVQQVGRGLTMGLSLPLTAIGAVSLGAAVKMESLSRGLRAISEDANAARREMKLLEQVARLPGLGFRDAIQGSIRLQNAGASADMARESLLQFGNAIALVGGGKAELDGVTLALTQILSAGTVLGQEIRQLQERVPQIRRAMIEAFGTARTEEIQAMGITSAQFIEGINEALAKLPRMSGGALNVLENLQDAVERAGVALGEAMLPVVLDLAEAAEELAKGFRGLDDGTTRWVASIGGAVALLGPLSIGLGGVTSAAVALNAVFKAGLVTSLLGAGGLVVGLTLGIAALGEWALSSAAARRESESLRDAWRGLSKEGLEARESSIQTQIDETIAAIERFDRAAEVSTGNLRGNFERQGREARRQLIALQGELQRTQAALAGLGRGSGGGGGTGGLVSPGSLSIGVRMLEMLEERADSLSEKAEALRLDLQFEQDAAAAGKLRDELSAVVNELERVNEEIARQKIGGAGVPFRAAFGGQKLDLPGMRARPGIGEGIGDVRFEGLDHITNTKAKAWLVKEALKDTAEGLSDVAQGARAAAPLLGRFGGTLSDIVGGIAQGGVMGIGSAIISGLSGLFGDQRNVVEENTRALKLNTDSMLRALSATAGGQVSGASTALGAALDRAPGGGGMDGFRARMRILEEELAKVGLSMEDLGALAESMGLTLDMSKESWEQFLGFLESDIFGGFSGAMRGAGLRAGFLDLDDSEQFDLFRGVLAENVKGPLSTQVAGLDMDSVGGFATDIMDQIQAGTFDFSQLGDGVSIDQFLEGLANLESLGDSAGGAADELDKLTSTLVNAPQGFKVAMARFDATDARERDPEGRPGGPARPGGVTVYGGVHIKADRGDDGPALYDKFIRELERKVATGSVDELSLLGQE